MLPSESKIYSLDKNRPSLQSQEAKFKDKFPFFTVEFLQLDFTDELHLNSAVDGMIMANSLHFVKDKIAVLKKLKVLLKPGGRLVMVEYNVDKGNHWVPYPFSFKTFKKLAKEAGFEEPKLAGTVHSEFLNQMYCAYTVLK